MISKNQDTKNVAFIGGCGHGKSTLLDKLARGLLAAAGRDASDHEGLVDFTSAEEMRGISLRMSVTTVPADKDTTSTISLVNTPGCLDFQAETLAGLTLADGAFFVVDVCEGVAAFAGEHVLRQCVIARVKPVLVLNKIDRLMAEYDMSSNKIIDILKRNIDHANVLLSQLKIMEADSAIGIYQFDPTLGNVIFASGLHEWAFTLTEFSEIYATRFGINLEKFVERMWGEHYFDVRRKKWIEEPFDDQGNPLENAFVSFILQPLKTLYSAVFTRQTEQVQQLLGRLGIKLAPAVLTQTPKNIIKACMSKWMPLTNCLVRVIKNVMPGQTAAFAARNLSSIEKCYPGLTKPIKIADPEGDLLAILVKRWSAEDIPVWILKVVSGTITLEKPILVSELDQSTGLVQGFGNTQTKITGLFTLSGKTKTSVNSLPAGSIGGITFSNDQSLKGGILLAMPLPNLKIDMNLGQVCQLQSEVNYQDPQDLPQITSALQKLAGLDLCFRFTVDQNTGRLITYNTGDLHLSICSDDLRSLMPGVTVDLSPAEVCFRETVSKASPTCEIQIGKERYKMRCKPLSNRLLAPMSRQDLTLVAQEQHTLSLLENEYQFSKEEATAVWSFGAPDNHTVLRCDSTLNHLSADRKSAFIAAFEALVERGLLVHEPLVNTEFRLVDAVLHETPGEAAVSTSELISAATSLMQECFWMASPRILEPVSRLTVLASESCASEVQSVLTHREATVMAEHLLQQLPVCIFTAEVPTSDRDIVSEILKATGGMGFSQLTFAGWRQVPGHPVMEKEGRSSKIVQIIRARKSLPSIDLLPEVIRVQETANRPLSNS